MHVLTLMFGLMLVSVPALAETVHIAVAANFRAPMQALQAEFQAETEYRISISTGASGQLFAQISNGAPFDVFLSADQARPAALIAGGHGVTDSQFTYATGRLYLLVRRPNVADTELPDLSGIRRLSIANPRTAPYGHAAMQVLEHLTFPNGPPQIAQAQSISGVNAAMTTGAVDAGFAAFASVAMLEKTPDGWLVPDNLHDPIRQDAVLLERASKNIGAKAFLRWLKGPKATQIIKTYGYHVD